MNQRAIHKIITFEPMRQHALLVEVDGRLWILRPDLLHALTDLEVHPDLPTIDW